MTSAAIVITGLGATTPVGGDVPSTWSAWLEGRSGVVALTEEWAGQLPARIAGRIAVEPGEVMDRVEMRKLDRSQQLALIASREAWKDSGLTEVDPTRLAVVVATGVGGVTSLLEQYDILRERGASRVSPHTVPMLMPNGPAAVVGLELGARAGVHTPVSACASGAEAIAFGARLIREGKCDVVVAGGTEACIHPLTLAAFAAMRALSTRNDDPAAASRPYDVDRDGFVMGEGAGLIVMERSDHAAARGAHVYAVYGGAGITADAHHIAQPDPEGRGATAAMREALVDAELTATDIVHVNAHATSTPQGDVAEAGAIRAALGAATDQVAVTATKSMTGHLLGGAGAVESIAAILALYHRLIPPTINLDSQDTAVNLDVVSKEPRSVKPGAVAALNNSFGFGGHNVALAFRSAE
jgi:3-oxoacyl-[acyl-carrier-protein] synthase II